MIRIVPQSPFIQPVVQMSAYLVVPATAYRNTGLGSGIPDYRMAGLEKA